MSKKSKKLACPECKSSRIWKDGIRYTGQGEVQRYICRSCGFRFSESTTHSQVELNVTGQVVKESNPGKNFPKSNILQGNLSFQPSIQNLPFQSGKDVGSHRRSKVTIAEKGLNRFRDYNRDRLVCVSEGEAKNLAEVKSRTEKRAAGATRTDSATIKGKIIEYLWYLKKQGYAESTVKTWTRKLKRLAKEADLLEPESVKHVLARHDDWSNTYKMCMVCAYQHFVKMLGKSWKPPSYIQTKEIPFIPLEKEIDALIAGCGKKVAASLQLIKETGMRIGEAWRLRWIDIDEERRTIRCRSEKGGNPRLFKVSGKLIAMLNTLPKISDRVFGKSNLSSHRWNYVQQRKRLAKKLQNPRLNQITFHTFRHWKATMEYHRTKDILHVKKLLGHRRLDSTLIYTQLVSFEGDEYHVKVAKTVDEACELAKAGFDYFTTMDAVQIFRKRK